MPVPMTATLERSGSFGGLAALPVDAASPGIERSFLLPYRKIRFGKFPDPRSGTGEVRKRSCGPRWSLARAAVAIGLEEIRSLLPDLPLVLGIGKFAADYKLPAEPGTISLRLSSPVN